MLKSSNTAPSPPIYSEVCVCPFFRVFFSYSHNGTEKKKERSTLGKYAARVSPELEAYERRLCCILEGIEKNRILVRFSHIDRSEPEREFSFVFDISTKVYKGVVWLSFSPL
jgi:Chromosome segregation protein Spc25